MLLFASNYELYVHSIFNLSGSIAACSWLFFIICRQNVSRVVCFEFFSCQCQDFVVMKMFEAKNKKVYLFLKVVVVVICLIIVKLELW